MLLLLLIISGICLSNLIFKCNSDINSIVLKTGSGILIGLCLCGLLYWSFLVFDSLSFFSITIYLITGISILFLSIYMYKKSFNILADYKQENNIYSLIVIVIILISILSLFLFLQSKPSGGWDAYAIWNLKASFLNFPDKWHYIFDKNLVYSWPGYPLLLPSILAGSNNILSLEVWHIRIVHLIIFISVCFISGFAYKYLNKKSNLLFILILTSSPFFIKHSASQYADLLLSALVSASVFLALYKNPTSNIHTLIGFFIGCSALVKDEGILYLSGFIFLWIFINKKSDEKIKNLIYFILGLLIPVVFLISYKTSLDHSSVYNQSFSIIVDKMISVDRWGIIIWSLIEEIFNFDRWLLILPILLFIILVNFKRSFSVEHYLTLYILLVSAGFYFIYLITPHELAWHLETSLKRLVYQLWPLIVLNSSIIIDKYYVR